jgi:broad specificity phosphatase PhoE
MPANLVHLVRHGEVFNPDGILYGRIPGFHLSELGHRMAASAAASLAGHDVTAVYASPLQRTQESAEPWAKAFTLPIVTDDRIIEPFNRFEGRKFEFGPQVLTRPASWPWIMNPLKPSWGEPFVSVAARMLDAIEDAWANADGGEVVMVSHQMPIWMVARAVAGRKLYHDPRKRRCSLSSITTLARRDDRSLALSKGTATRFVEVDYRDPARDLLAASVDFGAV